MIGFRRASLLNLVARGEHQPLLERAVLLLLAARPELDRSAAWDWTLGERDGELTSEPLWIDIGVAPPEG